MSPQRKKMRKDEKLEKLLIKFYYCMRSGTGCWEIPFRILRSLFLNRLTLSSFYWGWSKNFNSSHNRMNWESVKFLELNCQWFHGSFSSMVTHKTLRDEMRTYTQIEDALPLLYGKWQPIYRIRISDICKMIWCTFGSSEQNFKQLQSSGEELLHNEAHSTYLN